MTKIIDTLRAARELIQRGDTVRWRERYKILAELDEAVAAVDVLPSAPHGAPAALLGGMTTEQFVGAELFAWQEATGCDTPDQFKAAQAAPAPQAAVQPLPAALRAELWGRWIATPAPRLLAFQKPKGAA